MSEELDRSSFDKLTTIDRRAFFFGLAAAGIAAGLGLPVGMEESNKFAVVHSSPGYWLRLQTDFHWIADTALWDTK